MNFLKQSRPYTFLASVALVFILAGPGCEGGGSAPSVSSSNTEATVHGTVKINGVAAKKGKVNFDPANINRKMAPASAVEVGPDGTYSLKTLVGSNNITFNSPDTAKDPKTQYFMEKFEVQSGDNTHDIEISVK